jgi:hypothetical protein
MEEALARYALQQAQVSFDAGQWAKALEWLSSVPQHLHPKDLVTRAHAFLSKEAIARGEWGFAVRHLRESLAIRPDPLLERRLPLIRGAGPLLDDAIWNLLRAKVDRAHRLPASKLAPEVTGVYTCGAYHAWQQRQLPWSVFLRIAKNAPPDTEEGAAALRLAGEFLCRVVFEETPLLRQVDVVAAVPANPARYVARMMSLPDELARALERHFALPFLFGALISEASDDLELRGLSWRERHEAIRGSMRAGSLGIGMNRTFLIVDDITTSGATLTEAARMLRAAGAADVYAVTLSHTEG